MKNKIKISNIKKRQLRAGKYIVSFISMKEKKGKYKYYELNFKILNKVKEN